MPTFLRSNFLKCPIFHNFRIRYVKKLGFNLELGSNQNWIRISSYINQNKVQLKIALKILEIWKLVIEIHLGLTRLHTICQTFESEGKSYSLYKSSFNFDPVYLAICFGCMAITFQKPWFCSFLHEYNLLNWLFLVEVQ